MGSPLSGTLAELYLQRIENDYIKQWIDSEELHYYKRYVDDIILFNINKIQEEQLLQGINRIDQNLTFKLTTEDNNKINFLDLTITRKINKLEIGIYRKETNTDTAIHYLSNHPTEQKMAAFRCYINRLAALPITQEEKNTERTTILNMAKNNGFPTDKIVSLKTQMLKHPQGTKPTTDTIRWATFTYHSSAVRKITNLFRNSNIRIAFRTMNTIFKQLTSERNTNIKLVASIN